MGTRADERARSWRRRERGAGGGESEKLENERGAEGAEEYGAKSHFLGSRCKLPIVTAFHSFISFLLLLAIFFGDRPDKLPRAAGGL
jgi:hypothetical protein